MSGKDTSSISFTAHYTGYVWFKQGWSHIRLATRRGACYYYLLKPIEWLARLIVGTDIKTTLLSRHALLDRELERNLNTGHQQVLEIAAGLSPRGWSRIQKRPQLRYIEADLPAMAERKQFLLTELQTPANRHQVLTCNILADEGEDCLAAVLSRHFDVNQPITVITEGLVNYFSRSTIESFWTRLAHALQSFPQSCYLTDVYPEVHQHRFSRMIAQANRLLGFMTRSQFTLHFASDAEAIETLTRCGFRQVEVFNPDQENFGTRIPRAHGGSVVRVIRACQPAR